MTLTTETAEITFSGNGITILWDMGFPVLEQSHLTIVLERATGALSTLVSGVDYTVQNIGLGNTASLVYPVSGPVLAVGEKLYITRTSRRVQDFFDIQGQGSSVDSLAIEQAIDRLVILLQDAGVQIDRAIKVNPGTLQNSVGNYLRVDETGAGFEFVPPPIVATTGTPWYASRDAITLAAASTLGDGAVVMIEGELYEVDSTATGTASAGYDAGVSGLKYYKEVLRENAVFSDTRTFYPAGTKIRVTPDHFIYEVAEAAAADAHLTTAGGVKLYYRPGSDGVMLKALLSSFSYKTMPTVNQGPQLQLAFDIAAETGIDHVNLSGLQIRTYNTISRKGVSKISTSGARVFFDTENGTFDYFKLDDGVTDANAIDAKRIAFDVSGPAFTIVGNLFLLGKIGLNKFQAVDRADIAQDLCGFAGKFSSVGEMTIEGQLHVEGFGDDRYVPANVAGFSSRQFARINGQLRSKFNLSPCGQFLAAANGNDDSRLNMRIDRCGGFGTITATRVFGTELNYDYFFGTGITDKITDPNKRDLEDSTITIVNADLPNIELSAEHPYLQAGDFIGILDAYVRASDGAVIPLVAKVTAVSGTTLTLDAKTQPNLTAASTSGLRWMYRPPRIELSNAQFTAKTGYFEGYWDCLECKDNCIVDIAGLKGGGVRLSGRHGAIINTTGLNNSIRVGAHRTLGFSNGIESIVAYGMIRYNQNGVPGDDYDAPLRYCLEYPFQEPRSYEQPDTFTLNFDAQTGSFTAGETLTGGTSGATATIYRIITDDDAPINTGTLLLGTAAGTFVDDETITDASTGSATADGTPTFVEPPRLTPPVSPAKGVEPVEFFPANRVSRFGTAIRRINVEINWTTMKQQCFFTANGTLQSLSSADGAGVQDSLTLDTAARFGSANKIVDLTDTAVGIFAVVTTATAGSLINSALYLVSLSNAANDLIQTSLVYTGADGNVTKIDNFAGDDFVLAGVGTSTLTAKRAAGSSEISCPVSVVRLN